MSEKTVVNKEPMVVHEVRFVEFYTCPNCKVIEFTKAFNACPRCGSRIEWVRLKK